MGVGITPALINLDEKLEVGRSSYSHFLKRQSGGSFRRRGSGRTNRCETPRMTKRLTSSSSGAGGDSSASSEASSLLTSPAGSSSSSAMSTSPKSSPEGNSNSGSFPAFAQSPPDSSPRGRSNSGNLDVGNDNDETRGEPNPQTQEL